ncbi:mitotic spindle assembly checkpoint protein MAD2B [Tieghemostelium lacteum]|uniref:Mitotic spindle assembly checkpoint protein MAD2B n=1 Tax=Tieghemostelium lacteum TaxID=361077 RepID=A0A152A0R6_TIELA|nr:mitotic spindle assembly checkpoint protein MAD2B [Tieghemostelium lacteum]|eukprot:KYQ99809.1 mitotic spindle assembly checkpoint protein MAD2B [Tieghemostelium lacteum]
MNARNSHTTTTTTTTATSNNNQKSSSTGVGVGPGVITNDSNSVNDNEFSEVILEFIEVAFHAILYIRGVYPSSTFTRSTKYDIPIPISRSDQLSSYISKSLDSIKVALKQRSVMKITLTILNVLDEPIEKYNFEPQFKKSDQNQLNSTDYYFHLRNQHSKPKSNLKELENSFRSYLLKLMSSNSLLSNHLTEDTLKSMENQNNDLKFLIHVQTNSSSSVSNLNKQPINQILNIDPIKQPKLQQQQNSKSFQPTWTLSTVQESTIQTPVIIPLKTMSDGLNTLLAYVEHPM